MKRRRFLRMLAATAVTVCGFFGLDGFVAMANQAALRRVFRITRSPNRRYWMFWRVRMRDLKRGDFFQIEENEGYFQAVSDPWQRDGEWGIDGKSGIRLEDIA